MNEFEIIARYFQGAHPVSKGNLKLGIGDDAAIIQLAADAELLVSMDTLVAGAHFFEDAPAEDIACKALAVNLSDMAAMGALPRWLGLSLTLPGYDADWLGRFATAFKPTGRTPLAGPDRRRPEQGAVVRDRADSWRRAEGQGAAPRRRQFGR